MRDATELGASLYLPATRPDLLEVVRGEKLAEVRSVIFCTEDSVSLKDLGFAINNLRAPVRALTCASQQMRFIRVRNPDVMRTVLALPGIEKLDGFVLPKVTRSALSEYLKLLQGTGHLIMPTLETKEVFDEREMIALRRAMDKDGIRERVLSLRIGGNDLLSIIGMRRPRGRTLYQTSLGQVIARLVTTFKPGGFNLSAPVFEYLNDVETLRREVEEDLAHGLIGKTAIHPEQVPLIHACYRVHASDLEMASHILSGNAPAVFRMHDSMCEPATHRNWAQNLCKSASCFGLHQSPETNSLAA
jgi:citrate lyase beta subunit